MKAFTKRQEKRIINYVDRISSIVNERRFALEYMRESGGNVPDNIVELIDQLSHIIDLITKFEKSIKEIETAPNLLEDYCDPQEEVRKMNDLTIYQQAALALYAELFPYAINKEMVENKVSLMKEGLD